MTRQIGLAEVVRVAYQRRWWLVVPVLLGAAAGLAAYELVPPLYRASTLIVAEGARVPHEYVKPTVTSSSAERLKTVEQSVTSRDVLKPLIEELDLHRALRAENGMEAAVQRTRRDVTIQMLGSNVLRIHFRAGDPELAARGANWIADRFIRDQLTARERQATGTTSFLAAEVATIRQRLEEQQARIADFKRLHMGQLPEERDTLLRSQESLQAELRITLDALDQAELRHLIVQRESGGAASVGGQATGLDRLAELRGELAELRARYTDLHPDVIRARRAVEEMEAALAAAPPAATSQSAAPAAARSAEATAAVRSRELLQAERQRILRDIAGLQARLDAIPRVEQELLALTRDYENISQSYQSLLARRVDAQLAENLERRRQDEQFTVLERAVAPLGPYFPNLLLMLVIGTCGGGLLGIAAAALREQTDQTYSDAEALQRAFPGLPVLATIPLIKGPARDEPGYHDARQVR
jgi:polysaccharide chain length determinant protein (PEP-CTERM system associated)